MVRTEAQKAAYRARYAAKTQAAKEAAKLKTAERTAAKWNLRHPDNPPRTAAYYLNNGSPLVSPIYCLPLLLLPCVWMALLPFVAFV